MPFVMPMRNDPTEFACEKERSTPRATTHDQWFLTTFITLRAPGHFD